MATKLRLQGSALAAALASPAVRVRPSQTCRTAPALATRRGGRSVVYHRVEPLTTVVRESAVSAEQEFKVGWRGADGLLDQMPDPEPIDGSPTRAAVGALAALAGITINADSTTGSGTVRTSHDTDTGGDETFTVRWTATCRCWCGGHPVVGEGRHLR